MTLHALTTGREGWRFPELALALQLDSTKSEAELRQAAADDLANALSPAAAVDRLIGAGAYEIAERTVLSLSEHALVDEEWTDRALEKIEDHQRAARDRFLRRCREIFADCKRIGVDPPNDLEELESFLPSAPILDDALDAVKGTVSEKELVRRDELVRLLDGAGLSPDSPRRAEVNDLIEQGELLLAEQALRRPAMDDRYEIPALAPLGWPRRTATLGTILYSFDHPEHRDPAITPFIPRSDDAPGQALVAALHAVEQHDPDAATIYATAVQGLIGRPRPIQPETLDGTTYVELTIPDDERLPILTLNPHRGPVRFAIGADPGNAAYRLSLEVSDQARESVTTVDLSDTLELLSLGPTGTRDRNDRLVLFLRGICSRLSVPEVVDHESFAHTDDPGRLRGRVWWLFYLMGYLVDNRQVNAFLELTGGRGALMVAVAELAVTDARRHTSGIAIEDLRSGPAISGVVLDAAFHDLGDHRPMLVLLCILRFRPPDIDALEIGMQNMLSEARMYEPATIVVNIPAAVATLADSGYIARSPDGGFKFGAVGGLSLITTTEAAERANRHMLPVVAEFRDDQGRSAQARILTDVRRMVEHAAKDLALGHAAGAAPGTVNVAKACHAAAALARQSNPSATIGEDIYDNLAGVDLDGDPDRLVVTIWNLLNNAAQSVRDDRPAVLLAASISERHVAITVNDNGPGFDDAVAERVNLVGRADSTKHGGEASGLATARWTAQQLSGRFTVSPGRNPPLNGGTVRLELPIG